MAGRWVLCEAPAPRKVPTRLPYVVGGRGTTGHRSHRSHRSHSVASSVSQVLALPSSARDRRGNLAGFSSVLVCEGGGQMVVEVANGYLIALSGRLDVSAVSEVRTVLHGAIDAGSGDLVVDLSAVEVVDATGLGLLL